VHRSHQTRIHSATRLARSLRFILVCSTLTATRAGGQAQQAATGAVLSSGTLSFLGHATVGDFVGTTSTMTGEVAGEVPNAHGWVAAPVATLLTQNDRRDRDLRASMEVDKYPTMRFDLAIATAVSSGEDHGDTSFVLLHGTFTIHGVSRVVALPAALLHAGDTLHVKASFPLDLADYQIGGLTKMFGLLRMQRLIDVRVDLRFVRASPRDASANQ